MRGIEMVDIAHIILTGRMATFTWTLLLAFTADAVQYRRICRQDEVDVGIRRAQHDTVATHTCVPGPLTSTCFVIDGTEGFNCTGDFHLHGGLPNRRSMCCNRLHYQMFGCSVPQRPFSFMQGFDIQLGSSVIRSIIPYPTPRDITTFLVEICELLPITFDPFGRKK